MKISDIRASLKRLAERLDNQWAYAQTSIKDDIAVGQVEYNDDGERLPIEPEISYYGMIAAFETLGGEWKRSSDGKHWLIWMGVAAIAPQDNEVSSLTGLSTKMRLSLTGSYGPAVLSAVSTLMVAVWDASTVTASTALS